MEQVENVHRVCLLKPGDIIIFSAAGAHMAMSLCEENQLVVSAYESFINFHPAHMELFLQTGNKDVHHRKFIMDSEDVYDIKDDMLDTIELILDRYTKLSPERQIQFVQALEVLKSNCTYFRRHITKILENREEKLRTMERLRRENAEEEEQQQQQSRMTVSGTKITMDTSQCCSDCVTEPNTTTSTGSFNQLIATN